MIQVHDVIQLAQLDDLGPTIVAADMMGPPTAVGRDQPLAEVFEVFETADTDELPVSECTVANRLALLVEAPWRERRQENGQHRLS